MRILVIAMHLDTSLIAIEKEFGGIDNYLREKIGLTPQLQDALPNYIWKTEND